jgi:hypothetical protein
MRYTLALALMLALYASPAAADDPALGATTFTVYEAWLSPAQEPGEESETPPPLKKSLGATAPSIPRDQRKSRGHGRIRFARDLSKAYVDVQITGVNAADILMFHIHCGPPSSLGPIVVDLGASTNLQNTLASGKLSVEITNKDIVFVKQLPRGLKFHLPESCPVEIGMPVQVKTLSGLEYLAKKGVLYFNLHTKAHTFYGEMRGQIYPAQAAR